MSEVKEVPTSCETCLKPIQQSEVYMYPRRFCDNRCRLIKWGHTTYLKLQELGKKMLLVFIFLLMADSAFGIEGKASWYSQEACIYNSDPKCPTATGESLYDLERERILFCASNDYRLGSRLRVTEQRTGRSVVVTVRDRGGFKKYGRVIDLGKTAFERIADPKQGIITVKIEEIKS